MLRKNLIIELLITLIIIFTSFSYQSNINEKSVPKKVGSIKVNLNCVIDNQLNDYPYDLHFKISSGEQVPFPINQEIVCNESKEINFDEITFDKTGVYQYRISCLNRGIETNDIIAVVNVTLNYRQLEAKITYYNQSKKDDNRITLKN